jgi:deoxyribose-phosphate aldolase
MEDLIARVEQELQALHDLPNAPAPDPVAAMPPQSLAAALDHTLLKPEATPDQIVTLCAEARRYGFASVCVNPVFVPLCAGLLEDSPVAVCTVVGFPLGATTTASKVYATAEAIAGGANEIDMVIGIGLLKGGRYVEVYDDIAHVTAACHTGGARCKVIIETSLLTDFEKVAACRLAVRAGVDFVKTSTGFAGGGATVADIALMRRAVGPAIGIKASGGVRDTATARALIAAGATRIGASAGVSIVQGETDRSSQSSDY